MTGAGTPAQEPQTPGEHLRRTPADPPQMSLTEKLACEREARHDVAARGRVADVAPVQHYLSHARAESRSASTGHRAARGEAQTPSAPGVSPGLRSWLRWGEDGTAPEHPVIPRC